VLWAAALLLVAGELWTASELRGLRETEDVRDAAAIEQALRRLEEVEASRLLAASVLDGTASPFAVELYLELSGNVTPVARERIWQILAPYVARSDRRALLAAARLDHPKASNAVRKFLRGAEIR
jgi:hypothetical protein